MAWGVSAYYKESWRDRTTRETVTHKCGHQQDHEMYGGKKKRAAWSEVLMERTCTACWKAEQDAVRKATPITAEIARVENTAYISVIAGDTFSIKDTLKAAGCRWSEWIPADALTSEAVTKSLRKVWTTKCPLTSESDTVAKLTAAGVAKWVERPVYA